ncbi:MAG: isocitrate/isopropylmalate family dehydrogenase [Patescibacteria group bacterium]
MKVVFINGDGIGPEVMNITRRVLDVLASDQIQWIEAHAGRRCHEATGESLPAETLALLREHRVGIKGPTETPSGGGFTSANVRLRQELDLFVGLRPAVSMGLPGTRDNVNLVTFRENTEGLYACSEEQTGFTVVLTARFTAEGMRRLAASAFVYALEHGYDHVTLVTKENIHKVWGRLYHDAFNTVAQMQNFRGIRVDHMLVDAMCMSLVRNPSKWGVIVTENMFGDIISDLCAGLVGGLGVTPGANIGAQVALFEAVHGSAPDIAGMGIANPAGLLLSGGLLLDHLGLRGLGNRLRNAIAQALRAGEWTRDIGGELNTYQFTQAVLARV